jgi:hypothetical protein
MPIVIPDRVRVGRGDEGGQSAQEVERLLRLSETCRRPAKDLVGPPGLPVLALQLLEPLPLCGRHPGRRPWSRPAWLHRCDDFVSVIGMAVLH